MRLHTLGTIAAMALCLSMLSARAPARGGGRLGGGDDDADGARDPGGDPQALIAALAGSNVPRLSMMRAIPQTPAVVAARQLVAMGDRAVPALTRGLDSDDPVVRLNAAYVLGRIGTPATVAPRVRAVADPEAAVAAQAVAWLPVWTDPDARRVALAAAVGRPPAVRLAAVRAFRLHERPEARRDPKQGPGNAERHAVASVLVRALEDDDAKVRFAAADTLGSLGANVAARPLLKLLDDPDALVRQSALEALGAIADPHVAPDLLPALRHAEEQTRASAAMALGRLADLRATAALVEALKDQAPSVRRSAAEALGRVGDVRAVPALVRALRDEQELVRAAAAEALGLIRDAAAVEPLIAALRPGSRESLEVARALGRLGDARAVPPLRACLLTPGLSQMQAEAAADALGAIRHPDAIAALVEVVLADPKDSWARPAATAALRRVHQVELGFKPLSEVRAWWEANRERYLRPVEPAGAP